MAKIRLVTAERAAALPEAAGPGIASRAYLDGDGDALHLFSHSLDAGAVLGVRDAADDQLLYVLDGHVMAGGVALSAGSSLIVEYGAAFDIAAGDAPATILQFQRARRPQDARRGGQVHLMPREHVPTVHDLGTQNEMGGGLHADAACATCTVWLHENDFHRSPVTVVDVHSHSEDEIIFVTAGEIRLGARIYGRGTALAVAANTKYGFEALEGLSFINFRAASPTVTTRHGVSDEASRWIARLGRPPFVAPRSPSPAKVAAS